jgi:hypothetical protein
MEKWTIIMADTVSAFLNPENRISKFLNDAEKKKINVRQCDFYQ